jgi:hypothetical protein
MLSICPELCSGHTSPLVRRLLWHMRSDLISKSKKNCNTPGIKADGEARWKLRARFVTRHPLKS